MTGSSYIVTRGNYALKTRILNFCAIATLSRLSVLEYTDVTVETELKWSQNY